MLFDAPGLVLESAPGSESEPRQSTTVLPGPAPEPPSLTCSSVVFVHTTDCVCCNVDIPHGHNTMEILCDVGFFGGAAVDGGGTKAVSVAAGLQNKACRSARGRGRGKTQAAVSSQADHGDARLTVRRH